jgi:hypothetical protein
MLAENHVHETAADRTGSIKRRLDSRMATLRRHSYFKRCHSGALTAPQLLGVAEQLYCFSVYFERLLTRRLSMLPSRTNATILEISRQHLAEEIGHAKIFRGYLQSHGLTAAQVDALAPKTYTRALFGYLLATLEYENEFVANIAIVQVMELIALNFFTATRAAINKVGLGDGPFELHSVADDGHAELGLELCGGFDEHTLQASETAIDDLFVLMPHVFEEWLPAAGVKQN